MTAHTHASPTQFYGVCQESGVLAVHSDSVKLGTKSGHNDARDFLASHLSLSLLGLERRTKFELDEYDVGTIPGLGLVVQLG